MSALPGRTPLGDKYVLHALLFRAICARLCGCSRGKRAAVSAIKPTNQHKKLAQHTFFRSSRPKVESTANAFLFLCIRIIRIHFRGPTTQAFTPVPPQILCSTEIPLGCVPCLCSVLAPCDASHRLLLLYHLARVYEVMRRIRKCFKSSNTQVILRALDLTDTLMQSCGSHARKEVSSDKFLKLIGKLCKVGFFVRREWLKMFISW